MEKVLKLIKDKNLVRAGDVVAVACSGGADSMALLNCLKKYENELDIEVVAVHINHSIRENANHDEAFVKNYCAQKNIRFYSFKVDVPAIAKSKSLSLESAGREARYGIFDALVTKGLVDKIALAHHLQDQAETILLHLFRGSGLAGVCGMDYKKDNHYIRPLLGVCKEEILHYINKENIGFVEDETNAESAFARNFIRNEILPKLKEKWPNIVNNLVNFAKFASEDEKFIQNNLNDGALILEEKTAKIPMSYFLYDESIINRIIFKALHAIGVYVDIERKHINAIKLLARNSENGKRLNLPFGVTVYKEYEYITITNKASEKHKFFQEFKIGDIEVPNFGRISVKRVREKSDASNALYLDFKKLPTGVCWRNRKEGDIFTKFGGGTKKLKDYLIDKKIPKRERDLIPLLADGSEVYAIAGVEISDKVKVDNNVRSIIKIETFK